MSRNEPRINADQRPLLISADFSPNPCYPWLRSTVWRTRTILLQCETQARSNGDQVALFYCKATLDHSESSMLVSAGFESHRPVNN